MPRQRKLGLGWRQGVAKNSAILIDDPIANSHYDLRRTLRGWRFGLAAVITPVADTGNGAPDSPASEAFVGKNDSDTTRALKNASIRYHVEGKEIDERDFHGTEGVDVLVPLAGSAPVLVSFVSYATAPLIVALAHADAFKNILRVGITQVRMDTNYNLARKLIVDELIHYHEHTRVLEKVFCKRLALMLQAHEARQRARSG
jgi:hypothetical protein